ncbi:Aste57867_14882 [Aphanomyces stellatus]|uniref:Aste57867_14882 protein n=1 Tax=Aphanomyces stellatus TaxID=120398 RepID=A0A485L4H1_9STRA|nr:hypothetical protein As57867_014826 [Aphanomyces stellatus]VFT91699.1 Aste57867_14882 [Aphanomyces stellatus]
MKKTDVNDYSRFNDIVDSDEEKEKAKDPCRNCSKGGAKLKCSVCKKAAYCDRKCQTSDWSFHRRTCKKPEEKKKENERPKRPEESSSNGGTGSSSSSTSNGEKKSSKPIAPRTEIVKEDEDIENARGYKNGMPYFHREQSEHEKSLIGDIAPKKIEVAPPVPSVDHDGSAWNHAGTFEQRDLTKWSQDRLKELLANLEFASHSFTIRAGEVKDMTGDASICVVRGKKRFLFDFGFKLEWEAVGKGYKGKVHFHDISNDGDYEIECKYEKRPANALEAAELREAVAVQTSGVQKLVLDRVAQYVQEYQAL